MGRGSGGGLKWPWGGVVIKCPWGRGDHGIKCPWGVVVMEQTAHGEG